MSARFGRNQKRRLLLAIGAKDAAYRHHVAETQALFHKLHADIKLRDDAIASLRVGDWMKADGTNPDLADLVSYITAQSITEGTDQRGRRERVASLDVIMSGEQLYKLQDGRWGNDHRNGYTRSPRSSYVEWNGGVWFVDEVAAPKSDGSFGYFTDRDPVVEIKLIAVPQRGERDQYQYAFGRDRVIHTRLRAVGRSDFVRADPRPVMRVE